MSKKNILIIIIVVGSAFFNSLFNGFVGDDITLIVTNTFYKDFNNIWRLFESSYFYKSSTILLGTSADFGSGSVTYRPVDNLTYFFDYMLWGMNPFGFHLTNVIIHAVNVVLIYLVLLQFELSSTEALFACLLFGVHPIQSEAVSAIGYRADVLAAFFVLLSFHTWLIFSKIRSNFFLFISLFSFFLAVFTKESAVVFPIFLFFLEKIKNGRSFKYQFWFWLILLFYIYIYLYVFPTSFLNFHPILGAAFYEQGLLMIKIFLNYLSFIICPWMANSIPPMYIPNFSPSIYIDLIVFSIFALIFGTMLIYFKRRSLFSYLMILWFLIFYIPISNFKVIVNPIALRFIYLPSIGLIVLLALMLHRILDSSKLRSLYKITTFFSISVLLVLTFFLNAIWHDMPNIVLTWNERYPDSWKANYQLGRLYLDGKKYKEASRSLINSALNNAREYDILIDYYLGLSFLGLDQYARAERHFNIILSALPDYPMVYWRLAQVYKMQGEYQRSMTFYIKSLDLDASKIELFMESIDLASYLLDERSLAIILSHAAGHLSDKDLITITAHANDKMAVRTGKNL